MATQDSQTRMRRWLQALRSLPKELLDMRLHDVLAHLPIRVGSCTEDCRGFATEVLECREQVNGLLRCRNCGCVGGLQSPLKQAMS